MVGEKEESSNINFFFFLQENFLNRATADFIIFLKKVFSNTEKSRIWNLTLDTTIESTFLQLCPYS